MLAFASDEYKFKYDCKSNQYAKHTPALCKIKTAENSRCMAQRLGFGADTKCQISEENTCILNERYSSNMIAVAISMQSIHPLSAK